MIVLYFICTPHNHTDDISNTAGTEGPLSTTAHDVRYDPSKSLNQVRVYVNYNSKKLVISIRRFYKI
jgi:hypothetical protein